MYLSWSNKTYGINQSYKIGWPFYGHGYSNVSVQDFDILNHLAEDSSTAVCTVGF